MTTITRTGPTLGSLSATGTQDFGLAAVFDVDEMRGVGAQALRKGEMA